MALIKGLIFYVLAFTMFLFGGLANAVKVKAQDPAPAKQSVVLKLTNVETSVVIKSVNEKTDGSFSVKQENKVFSYPDNLNITAQDFSKAILDKRKSEMLYPKTDKKIFSNKEQRCAVATNSHGIHTIKNAVTCRTGA